jgi:hypothetical protein
MREGAQLTGKISRDADVCAEKLIASCGVANPAQIANNADA